MHIFPFYRKGVPVSSFPVSWRFSHERTQFHQWLCLHTLFSITQQTSFPTLLRMISRSWRLSRKVLQVRIWRDSSRDSPLPGHRRQCWLSTKAIHTVCWRRRQLWCRSQTHLLLAGGQWLWALESHWMPRRHTRARSSARTWARNYIRWVRNDNQTCVKGALVLLSTSL